MSVAVGILVGVAITLGCWLTFLAGVVTPLLFRISRDYKRGGR